MKKEENEMVNETMKRVLEKLPNTRMMYETWKRTRENVGENDLIGVFNFYDALREDPHPASIYALKIMGEEAKREAEKIEKKIIKERIELAKLELKLWTELSELIRERD